MPPNRQRRDFPEPQFAGGEGGQLEAATFIAAALSDLKLMSYRHRLDTLTYLLEVAHLEADEIVRFPKKKSER